VIKFESKAIGTKNNMYYSQYHLFQNVEEQFHYAKKSIQNFYPINVLNNDIVKFDIIIQPNTQFKDCLSYST
jgi:hypothetical protein